MDFIYGWQVIEKKLDSQMHKRKYLLHLLFNGIFSAKVVPDSPQLIVPPVLTAIGIARHSSPPLKQASTLYIF